MLDFGFWTLDFGIWVLFVQKKTSRKGPAARGLPQNFFQKASNKPSDFKVGFRVFRGSSSGWGLKSERGGGDDQTQNVKNWPS